MSQGNGTVTHAMFSSRTNGRKLSKTAGKMEMVVENVKTAGKMEMVVKMAKLLEKMEMVVENGTIRKK